MEGRFAYRPYAPGPLKRDLEERDGGGGHPLDARGLPKRMGADSQELLQHFSREPLDGTVIKISRDSARLQPLEVIHIMGLTVDISLVLGLDLDLLTDGGMGVTFHLGQPDHCLVVQLRAP